MPYHFIVQASAVIFFELGLEGSGHNAAVKVARGGAVPWT